MTVRELCGDAASYIVVVSKINYSMNKVKLIHLKQLLLSTMLFSQGKSSFVFTIKIKLSPLFLNFLSLHLPIFGDKFQTFLHSEVPFFFAGCNSLISHS